MHNEITTIRLSPCSTSNDTLLSCSDFTAKKGLIRFYFIPKEMKPVNENISYLIGLKLLIMLTFQHDCCELCVNSIDLYSLSFESCKLVRLDAIWILGLTTVWGSFSNTLQ